MNENERLTAIIKKMEELRKAYEELETELRVLRLKQTTCQKN